MKVSQLINELECCLKEAGDIPIEISIGLKKGEKITKMFLEQSYATSEPSFVVVEDYGKDGKTISIRDWPY